MADVGTNPYNGTQSDVAYTGGIPALDRSGLAYSAGLVKLQAAHGGTPGSASVAITVTKGVIEETTLLFMTPATGLSSLEGLSSTSNYAKIHVVTGNADVTLVDVHLLAYNTVTQVSTPIVSMAMNDVMTVGSYITPQSTFTNVLEANLALLWEFTFTNAAAHAGSTFEIIPDLTQETKFYQNWIRSGVVSLVGAGTVLAAGNNFSPGLIFSDSFLAATGSVLDNPAAPSHVGIEWVSVVDKGYCYSGTYYGQQGQMAMRNSEIL